MLNSRAVSRWEHHLREEQYHVAEAQNISGTSLRATSIMPLEVIVPSRMPTEAMVKMTLPGGGFWSLSPS